jgi:hypothetical protein
MVPCHSIAVRSLLRALARLRYRLKASELLFRPYEHLADCPPFVRSIIGLLGPDPDLDRASGQVCLTELVLPAKRGDKLAGSLDFL